MDNENVTSAHIKIANPYIACEVLEGTNRNSRFESQGFIPQVCKEVKVFSLFTFERLKEMIPGFACSSYFDNFLFELHLMFTGLGQEMKDRLSGRCGRLGSCNKEV